MADNTPCPCGAAPTASRANPLTGVQPQCLSCAAIDRVLVPRVPEKNVPVPSHITGTPAAAIHPHPTVWAHQGKALDILATGENLVIATPTASGKTLVFHLHSLHLLHQDPNATVLVLYPAKALANDQLDRWKRAAAQAGHDPRIIQQITGDTPVRDRPALLRQTNVLIITPDVLHAWLIRTASAREQSQFLKNLRLVITDEAHVYEDVLGTNAVFLYRRLAVSAHTAGNEKPLQHLAATATIQSPDAHLHTLTGLPFQKVDTTDSGAPKHPVSLLHIPHDPDQESIEAASAKLMLSILDADPSAQVILFHDSRQGAERVAAHAGRPRSIVPYRAGFLPEERRHIENQLRANDIRGIVTTSALEMGIDMPDLNYGINLNLPPTRKQLHQRFGRIGRARPATFVIFGEKNLFTRHGESLRHYHTNSVEESRLHLDNEFIAYQHALCFEDETKRHRPRNNGTPPEITWPPIFDRSLAAARSQEPPRSLLTVRARLQDSPPQLAYSMRSSGEESIDIIPSVDGTDGKRLGSINARSAVTEAFPGALYRHRGTTYTVKEWRRRRGKPYIRVTPTETSAAAATLPLTRRIAVLDLTTATSTKAGRSPWQGAYAQTALHLWTSAEGYLTLHSGSTELTDYSDEKHRGDVAFSRKSVPLPTTGFLLYLHAPWFASDPDEPPETRDNVASVLANDLCYQKSIARQTIGTITQNILVLTRDSNAFLLEDAILIYDQTHGGLGLTAPLAPTLAETTSRLAASPSIDTQALVMLNRWTQQASTLFENPPLPGPEGWWRTLVPGTPVVFHHPSSGRPTEATFLAETWNDGPTAIIRDDTGQDHSIPLGDIAEARPSASWRLWRPATGAHRDFRNDPRR